MRLFGPAAAVVAVLVGSATHAGAIDPTAIPLGGEPFVSTSPKAGSVDSCRTSFDGGGAQFAGPWIDLKHGTWNETTKLAVSGAVSWPNAFFRAKTDGASRVLTFDDLPTSHTSGTFPIASSDPAYAYDRNPNRIAAQRVTWKLPVRPAAAARPSCLGMGAIGVLSDGVYGIYVVKDAHGAMPTNSDLDACHGTTSRVRWNGKVQSVYHYVATLEYPYTLGCYHGTPIATARRGSPPP